MKVQPNPSPGLVTVISPWCSAMIPRTMARPNPRPSASSFTVELGKGLEYRGEQFRSDAAAGVRDGEDAAVLILCAGHGDRAPDGVNFRLLCNKFPRHCCRRTGSASAGNGAAGGC